MTRIEILLEIARNENLVADDFPRGLKNLEVQNARAGDKPKKLTDGGGLHLYIPPKGAKVWRYAFRLEGVAQTLSIGPLSLVGLSDARTAHRAARWLVSRKLHPLAYATERISKLEAEHRARTNNSFRGVAEQWMDATSQTLAVRTVKHRTAMLEKHIFPKIGDRVISDITRLELRSLLLALDAKVPVTARHCRGYIKQIFEWAEDAELVHADPTPRLGVLSNASRRTVVPRKAIPLARLGEFLHTLSVAKETASTTKAALRLCLLTWTRTSETTGARWDEFDLAAGKWVIPSERMKAKEPHTIYLSRQALELLDGMDSKKTGFVFPNRRRPSEAMNRTTFTEWRKRHGFADIMEIHGLRAVASTWANESGKYRPDVVEVALAHKEGDRVRRAYNRAKFADELREMWQAWADQCDALELLAEGG